MKRTGKSMMLSAVLVVATLSCDKTVTRAPDLVPPTAVNDLAAGYPMGSAIRLIWSTPGDDDNVGVAAKYDVRYSTAEIDLSNWDEAVQVPGEPQPDTAGVGELFTVSRLQPNTRYYFALKTADEADNWSGLSNIAEATTSPAPGAQWEETYGGFADEYGYAIDATSDGGYVVAGFTKSFGSGDSDVYLIKIDGSGNLIWEKAYGGTGDDFGHAVAAAEDGGCVVAGWSSSFGALDHEVYLFKVDAEGNLIWQNTFGRVAGENGYSDDRGYAIVPTPGGGFLIAGSTRAPLAEAADVYLIKVDAAGDREWDNAYGGADWEEGRAVVRTADDAFIIAGYAHAPAAGDANTYVIKIDESGGLLWDQQYPTTGDSRAYAAVPTSWGGCVIAGYVDSMVTVYGLDTLDIDSIIIANREVLLAGIGPEGDKLWEEKFGRFGDDRAFSVCATDDGGYVVAGYTNPFGPGNDDVYLIETGVFGDLIWETAFGGSGNDLGYGVLPAAGGQYVVVGITDSFNADEWDVIVIKTERLEPLARRR